MKRAVFGIRYSVFGKRLLLLLVACLMGACGDAELPTPTVSVADEPIVVETGENTATAVVVQVPPTDAPTATPMPTATPVPLAVVVNDEAVTLAAYEARLAQFRQWFPNGAPDGRDIRVYTLEQMIE